VVAAPDSPRGGERIRDRVLAWWEQFHLHGHLRNHGHGDADTHAGARVAERGGGPVAVRCAILSADEVGEAREGALRRLAEALLQRDRPGAGEWFAGVPFPLAAVVERARRHRTTEELAWAVEVTLRLVAAVLAAGLRRSPDAAKAAGLARTLGESARGPLRLAADAGPVLELARLARGDEDRFHGPLSTLALSRMGRRLIRRANGLCGRASALDHGELQTLAATLEELAHGVALQLDCRLASVEEIVDLGDGDETVYRLRWHQGPAQSFPAERVALPWRLRRGWCVAMDGAASERPLSLAPLFAAQECETCGRLEVFVGDDLTPGPREVLLRGLLTGHEARLLAPGARP
jgi:hypothetical protein